MNFKNNAHPSNFNANLFRRRYAKAGKYFHFLETNVLPFFDESQVKIVVMENMKNNTTEEMGRVFNFLGVDDLGLQPKIIDGVLRRTRTRNEDVALSYKEDFYRVWNRHPGKLSGDTRMQLLSFYKSYNEKLFEYLGYEVKGWNK